MSDVIGLQRREAVERHRRVGRRVSAGALNQHLVTDLQADREHVGLLLVQDVGGVAGRSRQHAGCQGVAVPRGADWIANRLVHGLGETAETADVEIDPTDIVFLALIGYKHDLSLNGAGTADHAAARLDDRLRDAVAEMLAQRLEDGRAVGFHRRHVLQVLGREAAAEVDYGEIDAALTAFPEYRRRRRKRTVPGMLVALLGSDMERHTNRLDTRFQGVLQHVDGHGWLAAELAGEGPFCPDAVGEDAAEHATAGRGPGDLLDLSLAVDRIEAHAKRVRAGDVALLLDGVAIRDAIRRGAGREHHLDFGDRSSIETGADLG